MPTIQKSQVMPLILAACPGFQSRWDEHLEFWKGEEAGVYNDLGAFAHFIVDAYECQDIEPIVAAFGVIERLLGEGDEEVQTAAAIGFLEDVRNIASHRPFGEVVFVQWLGPKSGKEWAEIEEVWRGKTSLMDVVRTEIKDSKNKQKS